VSHASFGRFSLAPGVLPSHARARTRGREPVETDRHLRDMGARVPEGRHAPVVPGGAGWHRPSRVSGVPGLPGGLPFGALIGDRAFGADWLLEDPEARGAEAVIPSRRNRTAPREHDREMYGWRHLVDSFLAKTREFRAIATRHDRTGESFTAGIAPSPAWWPRHDCQRAPARAGKSSPWKRCQASGTNRPTDMGPSPCMLWFIHLHHTGGAAPCP